VKLILIDKGSSISVILPTRKLAKNVEINMGKHIIYVVLKKLRLFRIFLRTLRNIALPIIIIFIFIYIFYTSFPELFESIIDSLIRLFENIVYSLIGLFKNMINSLISTIMQEQVVSKIYQTIYLVFILFITFLIFKEILKVTNWAQGPILALSKNETGLIVVLKIHKLYQLFTKYEEKKREVAESETAQKETENKIKKVSNIINDYEKRKQKLAFQEEYGNERLSRISEIEKKILLHKILRAGNKKADLEKRKIKLVTDISSKGEEMEEFNQNAHEIIVKRMNHYYFRIHEKYERFIWLKNKATNDLKKLYSTLYEDLRGAISKIIRNIISAFTKLI